MSGEETTQRREKEQRYGERLCSGSDIGECWRPRKTEGKNFAKEWQKEIRNYMKRRINKSGEGQGKMGEI